MNSTRALVLTDVVESTALAERLGDAGAAALWAAHDRVARDLLPRWRGREIDKTDGMLLMFDSASDAFHYALAYHHGVAALPVPVKARAGLHVGPVILRENSPDDVARGAKPLELDGLAKPIVARVMSIARGGQTLLTRQAVDALGDAAGPLEPHGHWLVKGVGEPVELFAPVLEEADLAAPEDGEKAYRVYWHDDQWRPVQEVPNNLPQQATTFVGREREVREVKAQLGKSRLLTLLGMGGLGKTRLSLRVATEQLMNFPDGAWFLDLAPLREAAHVAQEAARVLGIREDPDRPLVQTLVAALKTRRLLLIFDNCEHLVAACAELANTVLRAAPQVRILASSREPLHVPGEFSYPVHPLPVPDRGAALAVLARSTAVRLFVDRAQQHRPGFEFNAAEAPAVAELVARLEGIPLALELAAARVRMLSVAEINARLKDRYKLLTGGSRVLQARQQTLRALVDWSYDMLEPDEQRVFSRLAVFAGGFDLEAVEAVCGAEPLEPFDVMDLLGSIVAKSLVIAEDRGGSTRYRMLETIRDYAQEKLREASEAESTAVRHCNHFFAMAKTARDALKGQDQPLWIRRVDTDLDNFRAALALALTGQPDPFVVVKFAIAMMAFWMLRGYATEGRGIVQAALALPAIQASDQAHAHALYVDACLASAQHDHEGALRQLATCLELRRRLGKPLEVAATLSTMSVAQLQSGHADTAAACEQEALALFRANGNPLGEAIGLLHLGEVGVFLGDHEAARASLLESLRIAQHIKNREVEGEAELKLGECAFDSGDMAQAALHFSRSLAVCTEAGDRRGEALASWWLGRVALESGELPDAAAQLGPALKTFHDFEMREALAECLEDHAVLELQGGDSEAAVCLASAAQAYRARFRLLRSPFRAAQWNARRELLLAALPDMERAAAWEAGQRLDVGEMLALAAATSPA
jgi:predicted ATPase/class 3 adenylate cyclase